MSSQIRLDLIFEDADKVLIDSLLHNFANDDCEHENEQNRKTDSTVVNAISSKFHVVIHSARPCSVQVNLWFNRVSKSELLLISW